LAGGRYTDEIRYFDHYISLSQGFGFGWRPDASGGIGMLVDRSGNDVYVSDIFGQGSSYWFAVGGLVDYAGNDQYVSYQYAQGAGTHITVAALVDCEGDDNYVSKGVSQGCGHDLAIGLLHDLAGDDNYTCHDLSQAAGNANGIGVLMDDEGDDAYSVRDPNNTHGYGNLRRDYGSVGVFLDCGGSDYYAGRGADGSWWTGSVHGIGIDTEKEVDDEATVSDGPASAPAMPDETEEAEVDTIALVALTPEELFLRASSSALQFEHMREPSRVILVRDHERSIPYLVTQLDTDDARERHALEDVLVRIGTPAVAPVIDALLAEAARPDTTRGVRLAAGVLGRLGDPAAVEPLDSIHDHPEWKVRGAIAGALGRIGTADAVGPLVSMLTDENEVVRKSAAVGLRRVAVRGTDEEEPDVEAFEALDAPVIEALVRALGDPHYSVRHSASDALARIGEPALTHLMEIVEGGTGEARLMALQAVGAIGSGDVLRGIEAALDDRDWAVRAHAAAAIGAIGPDSLATRALERLVAEDDHPLAASSAADALEKREE
jgi:HEAT repeat protein